MGGSSAWTRSAAPECGDTLKALAGDQRPIQGGDRPRRRLRGPAAPYPSVAVRDLDTDKVLREADGPEEM